MKFARAGLTGITAAVVASIYLSKWSKKQMSTVVPGATLPLWGGIGVAVAAGNIISDVLHQYAYPKLGLNAAEEGGIYKVTEIVASGAGAAIAMYLQDPRAAKGVGILPLFALGAGSEVVTQYLWSNWLEDMPALNW